MSSGMAFRQIRSPMLLRLDRFVNVAELVNINDMDMMKQIAFARFVERAENAVQVMRNKR